MPNCRVITHHYLKKGMDQAWLKFLESDLIKQAERSGAHHIEFAQNDKNPNLWVSTSVWNSLEGAVTFQATLDASETNLAQFYSAPPKQEVFMIRNTYAEKAKKAA